MEEIPGWKERSEAALALLRALGVEDVEDVVRFVLTCDCREVPTLVVERYVDRKLGGGAASRAASDLAPHVAVEERAVWGG